MHAGVRLSFPAAACMALLACSGASYAIDLLVYGVNPGVYDPPATPPFSDANAFAAMRTVIQGFRFATPAGQSAASASTAAR